MKEILGEAKTIRQLLSSAKYAIDLYQREYKWQTKQVSELLDDLETKFLDDFRESHPRSAVEKYGHYFLGSIVISRKDGRDFIIDGQQRLTTLTLLLIFLHNLQRDRDDAVKVDDMIYSQKYARKSFNLDVKERVGAMVALFNDRPFDESGEPESVRNIIGRYRDIEELFPQELKGSALPYFADWLIENVHLVEISAHTDDDAYMIFETMNDRGLSLSPTDMLKGYLIANIDAEQEKLRASQIWKARLGALTELGKEEEADFLKAWLRGQHAQTIRERRRGAKPLDFERIGTEFHRWVRDNREALGLLGSPGFSSFIERDLDFYARQYARIRDAAIHRVEGLERIFYNALNGFTLQRPVLLAPLTPDDPEEAIDRKLRAVSAYVDILLARRLWNFRSIAYSTMQYAMFLVIRDIRGAHPDELVAKLRARLDDEEETFASNDRLRMHQQNRYAIHHILARLTEHVERESGMQSRFLEYVGGSGQSRYDVEHIWADKPERHTDEFPHPADLAEYRSQVGGLLLLPRSFNQSYGDLAYTQKLRHYDSQNLLARSLHPSCYERNPGFLAYIRRSGLAFRPHPEFKRADLDERQELYRRIAEQVWNPDLLSAEVGG